MSVSLLTVSVSSQICEEIGVKAPVNVKMFTGKSKLLLFSSLDSHLFYFEWCTYIQLGFVEDFFCPE